MKKKIWIFMIICGVLIIACPFVGQWITGNIQNRIMQEWLDSGDVPGIEISSGNAADAYNELQDNLIYDDGSRAVQLDDVSNEYTGNTSDAGSSELPSQPLKMLGIIQIDKIKVKCPVVDGIEPYNLRVGVGHLPGTASLGQPGNCALAGHRSYTFGKFFNRLDELEKNDEISIITKKQTYKYKVYDILIVKPDDLSVLKGSKDDNVITLITCTPIYLATHRLIVQARLEE